jgi:predicted TIM-barrel fold metal-dependent hydrolase
MIRLSGLFCFIYLFLLSCQNSFYSERDFNSVRKIDSHIHINTDKGDFEEVAKLDSFILITLNVDNSSPSDIEKELQYALLSAKKNPGTIFYGSTFFFDTAGWGTGSWSKNVISYLEHTFTSGIVTVKLWKNIGMTVRDSAGRFIMIDNPGLDPVIDFIENRGLPVTGHFGEPRNCWLPLNQMTVSGDSSYFAENPQYHMFLHPEYPSYEDQIDARDNFLKRHPDLKFIGCHLGSLEWNVDSLAKRLDKFPNMAVDMSARICHLQYQSASDRKRIRDFCIKYQDRLLYGTDTGYDGDSDPESFRKSMHKTWLDDWRYFTSDDEMTSDNFKGKFTGLKLPKEVVNKIYSENAIKWYKLNLN